MNNSADDSDLVRSMAIWDYRLRNCVLPVYSQFSARDNGRPYYERRAERKRRHHSDLFVPAHAGELSAITRSTVERLFSIVPQRL